MGRVVEVVVVVVGMMVMAAMIVKVRVLLTVAIDFPTAIVMTSAHLTSVVPADRSKRPVPYPLLLLYHYPPPTHPPYHHPAPATHPSDRSSFWQLNRTDTRVSPPIACVRSPSYPWAR